MRTPVLRWATKARNPRINQGNIAVTFTFSAFFDLFEVAAKREIERGELCEIEILEFDEEREFNFVVMKDHFFRNRSMEFLQRLKAHSE